MIIYLFLIFLLIKGCILLWMVDLIDINVIMLIKIWKYVSWMNFLLYFLYFFDNYNIIDINIIIIKMCWI